MRRYMVLLVAIGLFVVAPAGAAVADSHKSLAIALVDEVSTGVADDGALLAEGTFTIRVGGVLVEQGTVASRYYVDESIGLVVGTRTYTADNGSYVMTDIKARVKRHDPVSQTTSYKVQEHVTASSDPLTVLTIAGRTVVVGTADGFSLGGHARWTFLN